MRSVKAAIAWAFMVLALAAFIAIAFDTFVFKNFEPIAFHGAIALVFTVAFCTTAFISLRS